MLADIYALPPQGRRRTCRVVHTAPGSAGSSVQGSRRAPFPRAICAQIEVVTIAAAAFASAGGVTSAVILLFYQDRTSLPRTYLLARDVRSTTILG